MLSQVEAVRNLSILYDIYGTNIVTVFKHLFAAENKSRAKSTASTRKTNESQWVDPIPR
jgi:hypothetical protein